MYPALQPSTTLIHKSLHALVCSPEKIDQFGQRQFNIKNVTSLSIFTD